MVQGNTRRVAWLVMLAVLALGAPVTTAARAEEPQIEPEAIAILKKMTDYLGSLQEFSVSTRNSVEVVYDEDWKLQLDFNSEVWVQRPNRLRTQRMGDLLDQVLLYDGKTLAIHNRIQNVYAVIEAPPTIDALLVFARENLDLVPPSSDLIQSNAFEVLTAPITKGGVVGQSMIGGAKCDHLAFRTPTVDWQIWIEQGDRPFPRKYVITTRNDPAKPQYVAMLGNWNAAPRSKSEAFAFTAPQDAKQVDFIVLETGQASGQ